VNVIQPLDIESGYRTISVNGENYLVITSKIYFPLNGGYPLTGSQAYGLLKEQAIQYADEFSPKLSTEYLVVGNACAPAQQAVSALTCKVTLAALSKSLNVVGDRYWTGGISGATEPLPFTEMPLNWEHAFGGNDVAENPKGKGSQPQQTPLGEKLICLPNTEAPGKGMTAKGQNLTPSSFAAIPPDWPQRNQYLGTYNDAWKRDAFPGFPADFNFKAFYCASEDQRFDYYLAGGEAFELEHLNSEQPFISGTLPSFRARSFLCKRDIEPEDIRAEDVEEVQMRMDTVVFYPNHKIGMLVFRGSVPCESMDADEYRYLMSAYESKAQEARSKEHYHQSLVGRTHPEFSIQYALTTKDLIPDGMPCSIARMTQIDEEPVQLIADNMKNRALREEAEARAQVQSQLADMLQSFKDKGLDTTQLEAQIAKAMSTPEKDEWQKRFDAVLEKLVPGASSPDGKVDLQKIDFRAFDELSSLSEEYAQFQKEQARKQLQDQLEELQDSPQVREALEKALHNMDLPPQLPRPQNPQDMLNQLRDAKIAMQNHQDRARSAGINVPDMPDIDLEEMEKNLLESAASMREAYRLGAHSMGHGRPVLDPAEQMAVFQQRQEQGLSHKGQDYACLDFTGRNLRGIDFSDCFLEQCRFDQCDLRGANLSGSIAARAGFIGADLSGCDLSNASIGGADLTRARLNGAQLKDCEYSGANFTEADLSDTHLTVMNSLEVIFTKAKLANTEFDEPTFIGTDFSDADFSDSRLPSATFMNCTLSGAKFDRADFSAVNFIECKMEGCSFREATLTNARFMMETTLTFSNFRKATLDNANLRDANITNADFTEASLRFADLTGANAESSVFNAADMRQSQCINTRFVRADLSNCNLMEASLMQADLQRADMRNSNCYGVEFMGAVAGNTDFSGSNMDGSKLEDWRPSKWQS